MSEVKFYLNNAKEERSSLYAVVYKFAKRYKYPTGISIDTKIWNADKMRCRIREGNMQAILDNDKIKAWEDRIESVMSEFDRQLIIPSQYSFAEAVKKKITESTDQEPVKIQGLVEFAKNFKETAARSDRTILRYGTTISILELYQNQKKIILAFNDIDMDFYESFKKWMNKQGHSLNYLGDMIKNIKTFMNEAEERGFHDGTWNKAKKFKTVSEEADTISLSVDKLIRIHRTVINAETVEQLNLELIEEGVKTDIRPHNIDRRVNALKDAKDRFLIGSFTALRFQDFNTLKGITSETQLIKKRNNKTGKMTSIPMHWVIREILINRNNILPEAISNDKMNKSIHLVCRMAGLTELKEFSRTEGGKRVFRMIPEYALVSSHTARRSACTNMYKAGILIPIIMCFSGHDKISNFMKYIRIDAEVAAEQMLDHPFFNEQ